MNHAITVTGMACGHCKRAVTRAVKPADPAAQLQIERAHHKVEVKSERAARALLAKAIADET